MKHIIINKKKTLTKLSKLKTKALLIIAIVSLAFIKANKVNAQSISTKPCYSLAIDANNNVDLYELDPATSVWKNIGNTGRSAIQSIAINPFDATIYAVDGGELGTLCPLTGMFNSIGMLGTGTGEEGDIEMNDIYGLTYSYTENVLYATHRVNGAAQNDLLIKIDPNTGALIYADLVDSFGNISDYALISTVYAPTNDEDLYNVVDIAFYPESDDLYAIHNSILNDAPVTLTIIDIESGELISVINELFEPISGIGHSPSGDLFATQMVDVSDASISELYYIEPVLGSILSSINIHPNQNPSVSFLCFECVKNTLPTSQPIPEKACYSLAIDANNSVDLYELDPTTSVWRNVGNTGRSSIQSIAINPSNATIYAVDGGELGTLNPSTGAFTSIGNIGNGNGETGQINMINIYGLTYSYTENVLYATQRVSAAAQNDLLIKINPNTGALINAEFVDSFGNTADYALIEVVYNGNLANDEYDVQDIAFFPETNDLYALHGSPGTFTTIDIESGDLTSVIYQTQESIGGFGYNVSGDLYAAQSVDVNNADISELFIVDLFSGSHTSQNFMHPNQDPSVSFLCFDCAKEVTNQPCESICNAGVLINTNAINGQSLQNLYVSSQSIETEVTASTTADVIVSSNETVDLKSDHITLNAGFKVENGACLNVIIEPCQ